MLNGKCMSGKYVSIFYITDFFISFQSHIFQKKYLYLQYNYDNANRLFYDEISCKTFAVSNKYKKGGQKTDRKRKKRKGKRSLVRMASRRCEQKKRRKEIAAQSTNRKSVSIP